MSDVDDPAYREIFGDQPSLDGGGGSFSYFTPSKLSGARSLDEPRKEVKVPTPAELGDQYKAIGKYTLADLGRSVTGIGELFGGPIGRASAEGSRYLEDVKKRAAEVDPSVASAGTILGVVAPGVGVGKILRGAKSGIDFIGRTTGLGALLGGAQPTGKEDLEQRLLEKGAYAAGGATLGAGLGMAGAYGQRIARDASAMGAPGRMAPGVKKEALQRGEQELAQLQATKRAEERMLPTLDRNFDPLKQAGLPSPDTVQNRAAGTDVNSQLRTAGERALRSAETQQEVIGGGAFTRYEDVAKAKQVDVPFGVSPEGQQLKSYLDEVVKGGAGPLQTFSKAEKNLAQEIRSELFGAPKTAVKQIDADIQSMRLPETTKIRMQQSRNSGNEGRKPVDFKLVDNKLRELRQLESARTPEGATAIARERLASAANNIEDSLRRWVGAENYPRETYRQASVDLNRFRTKIGEALTAKEDVPFEAAKGIYKTPQSKVADAIFGDADNARYARELLGSKFVNELGERYAVNQISGKSAAESAAWLRDPANNFINTVPGLTQKLEKYAKTLARRDGDQRAFEQITKDFAERERLGRDLQNLTADLRTAGTREVAQRASKFYQKLNEEGRITSEEFNRYNAEIDSLVKAYGESAEAKKRMIFRLIGLAGLSGVGGGYFGVRGITG